MELSQITRFDEKTEKKIVNALKKLIDLEKVPMSEEDALKGDSLFRTDVANVCMVEAKTPEARLILAKFIAKDWECPFTLPKLEFWETSCIEVASKYSEDYLKQIIALLSSTPTKNGSIEIKMKNTYPAQFSNQHWKLVLAPRVEDD
jgi:hypothetical protein